MCLPTASGGDEIDAFFTDSVLRVSEGQTVSVCVKAMGFINAAQSATLFRSATFLNASKPNWFLLQIMCQIYVFIFFIQCCKYIVHIFQ